MPIIGPQTSSSFQIQMFLNLFQGGRASNGTGTQQSVPLSLRDVGKASCFRGQGRINLWFPQTWSQPRPVRSESPGNYLNLTPGKTSKFYNFLY